MNWKMELPLKKILEIWCMQIIPPFRKRINIVQKIWLDPVSIF